MQFNREEHALISLKLNVDLGQLVFVHFMIRIIANITLIVLK